MYKIEISERTPTSSSRQARLVAYIPRDTVIISPFTSDELPGVEGVGECATLPDLSCDAKPEYEMTLRQVCQMVEQMGRIPYDMIRAYPNAHLRFGNSLRFVLRCSEEVFWRLFLLKEHLLLQKC